MSQLTSPIVEISTSRYSDMPLKIYREGRNNDLLTVEHGIFSATASYNTWHIRVHSADFAVLGFTPTQSVSNRIHVMLQLTLAEARQVLSTFPELKTVDAQSVQRMNSIPTTLKLLEATNLLEQYEAIVQIELLPNIPNLAIQDFGRINNTLMKHTELKAKLSSVNIPTAEEEQLELGGSL